MRARNTLTTTSSTPDAAPWPVPGNPAASGAQARPVGRKAADPAGLQVLKQRGSIRVDLGSAGLPRSCSAAIPPDSTPIHGSRARLAAITSQTESPTMTASVRAVPDSLSACSMMSGPGLACSTSAELTTVRIELPAPRAPSMRSRSSAFALVARTTLRPSRAVATSSSLAPGSRRIRPRYGA